MVIKKYNFKKIIKINLSQYKITQILLLIFIIINSILVISITYKTRLLSILKNNLYEEKILLDIEWRNLIIEENLLGNHNRIEYLSMNKLSMVPIELSKKNIIVIKQ